MATEDTNRFYALVHSGAPKGILSHEPVFRKQDDEATAVDLYCVVFFPRISGLGSASVNFYRLENCLAQTPEAAIVKFMDGMAQGQTWASYHDAGHRVRKVRVMDLGDAESGNTLSTDAPSPADAP